MTESERALLLSVARWVAGEMGSRADKAGAGKDHWASEIKRLIELGRPLAQI